MLIVGASKGAITIVLSLIVYAHDDLGSYTKDLILFNCISITGLSIILNSLTFKAASKIMSLEKLTEAEVIMISKLLSNMVKKFTEKI